MTVWYTITTLKSSGNQLKLQKVSKDQRQRQKRQTQRNTDIPNWYMIILWKHGTKHHIRDTNTTSDPPVTTKSKGRLKLAFHFIHLTKHNWKHTSIEVLHYKINETEICRQITKGNLFFEKMLENTDTKYEIDKFISNNVQIRARVFK